MPYGLLIIERKTVYILWTGLRSLFIENTLKSTTEDHLFIKLSDSAGEDAGFQKYWEKKMRDDTVDKICCM